MTVLTFRGYGAGAPEVKIVAARIVCWRGINYNGNAGTEIELDIGKSVRVGEYPSDVEQAVCRSAQG